MAPTDDIAPKERRQVTVLFADISGFTRLSERMDPEEVSEIVGRCFHVVEEIILAHGGAIDKFIGDCAMALFGVPRALEDAPRQAINAAIAVRERIRRLSQEAGLRSPLDVHIGVNSGLVVAGEIGGARRRDYTVMGATVNLAERLEDAAPTGAIYVGPDTYAETRALFEFRRVGPLRLSGISEPVTAYELMSRQQQLHRAQPQASDIRGLVSHLVGRDRELGVFRERFEQLVEGRGGVISVVGEAGVGKSRLLAEARKLPVTEKLRLAEGRCLSVGRTLGFHPFVDLLEAVCRIDANWSKSQRHSALCRMVEDVCGDDAPAVLPPLARLMGLAGEGADDQLEGIGGDALEKMIRQAMRRLIERTAARQPLLLVFEDLHWADRSSLGLLGSLLGIGNDSAILFVLLQRPEFAESSDALFKQVREAAEFDHVEIELERLASADCDRLIENLFGGSAIPPILRDLIKNRSEGNPFYVEEVVRVLLERGTVRRQRGHVEVVEELHRIRIPATIEGVLLARIEQLSEPERSVLQAASVIGRRLYRRIIQEVTGSGGDLDAALALLVEKEFIFEASTRTTSSRRRVLLAAERQYVFKHALMQQVAYENIALRKRRETHSRCAEAVEKLFADRIQDAYGMLAYHFTQAGEKQRAEDYLIKAGEVAARAAASAEALEFFETAYDSFLAEHGDAADSGKRAALEKNIGLALLNCGRLSESIEHFNNALRLSGERVPKGALPLRLKFAFDLPTVLFDLYRGSYERRGKRGRPNDRELFEVMYNRSRAQNPTDPERNFFDNIATMRHLRHLDSSSVPDACGMYAATGAFFAFSGLSFGVGRRFLKVAENLARGGRRRDQFQYRAMASIVYFLSGDWSSRHDMDEELLEEGLRLGLLWDADIYLGMVCERYIRQGRFTRAEDALAVLERLSGEFGYDFARSNQKAMRAFLLTERRELRAARDAIREYYDFRHEDTLHALALGSLAKIEIYDGRADEATRVLDQADKVVGRAGHLPPFYLGACTTARLLLDVERFAASGDRGDARAAMRSAKKARRVARSVARERVETFRATGRLYWLLRSRRRALMWWRLALEEAERLNALPELVRTCSVLADRADEERESQELVFGRNGEQWREKASDYARRLRADSASTGGQREPAGADRRLA